MRGGTTGPTSLPSGNWHGKPRNLFPCSGNNPPTIMPPRFCQNCGAALQFSAQKFCASCGATVPEMPAASPSPVPPVPAGIPLVVLAAGAVVVLIFLAAGALTILPSLVNDAGPSSSGSGSSSDGASLAGSPAMTPAAERTPLPVTTTTTTVPPSPPTTIPTAVPTTTSTPTPTPTATTTVPTPTPTPRPTSVITASETRVPEQPPASSYTSSTPGAPFIDPGALEARVHELTNVQRQNNGLATLSYDPFLADIARGHSWNMVQLTFFEHVDPNGMNARARGDWAGYPCVRVIGLSTYSGLTENLYMGPRVGVNDTNTEGEATFYYWRTLEDLAQVIVNGWMASPGHQKNILAPQIDTEGIGVAFGPDDTVYVTQNFC